MPGGWEQVRSLTTRFWLVAPARWLIALVACGAAVCAAGPARDPDVFWHVRLGYELVDAIQHGRPLSDAGVGWALARGDPAWRSTETAAEVTLAAFHRIAGWRGPVGWRMITTACAVLSLAAAMRCSALVSCRRPTPANRPDIGAPSSAVAVFAAGVWTLLIFAQERPQQASWIALPWCGVAVCAVVVHIVSGKRPKGLNARTLIVGIGAVWLWSLSHGLWLALPLGLAVAGLLGTAIGLLRHAPHTTVRGLGWTALAGGTLAILSCGPWGSPALRSALHLRHTTAHLLEWQPAPWTHPARLGWWICVALVLHHAGSALASARKSRPSTKPALAATALLLVAAGTLLLGCGPARLIPASVLLTTTLLTGVHAITASPAGTRAPNLRASRAAQASRMVTLTVCVCCVLVVWFLSKPAAPTAVADLLAGAPTEPCTGQPQEASPKRPGASTPQTHESPPPRTYTDRSRDEGPRRVHAMVTYDRIGEVLWLRPQWTVTLDPRMDRYPERTVAFWVAMGRGTLGPRVLASTVRRERLSVAIVEHDSPLGPMLRSQGWVRLAATPGLQLWASCPERSRTTVAGGGEARRSGDHWGNPLAKHPERGRRA